MPLGSRRVGSGLATLAGPPSPPLSDAQRAVLLGWVNWNVQSIICSDIDPVRHFIAGVVVEAAKHDPPLEVWVYFLAQQLCREGREGSGPAREMKIDTVTAHVNAMEAEGLVATRINDRRRRVVEATPKLVAAVNARVDLKYRLLVATLEELMRLGSEPQPPPVTPGGPLDALLGGDPTHAPQIADLARTSPDRDTSAPAEMLLAAE